MAVGEEPALLKDSAVGRSANLAEGLLQYRQEYIGEDEDEELTWKIHRTSFLFIKSVNITDIDLDDWFRLCFV
jgi:hypothetical protein